MLRKLMMGALSAMLMVSTTAFAQGTAAEARPCSRKRFPGESG